MPKNGQLGEFLKIETFWVIFKQCAIKSPYLIFTDPLPQYLGEINRKFVS